MNMKKVIASVIAGAVAVSAMATSAFAAETTETYKLTGEQWEIVSKGTSSSNDETVSIVGVALADTNQSAGTITFDTSSAPTGIVIDSLKAKITYKTVASDDGANVLTQGEKTVETSLIPNAEKTIWTLAIKTDNRTVNPGEVYIPAFTKVTNFVVTLESQKWYKTGVKKSEAEANQDLNLDVKVEGFTGGEQQIADLALVLDGNVKMPGTATAVASYPAKLVKADNEYGKARYLSDVYGAEETKNDKTGNLNNPKLAPSFVSYANNFFKGATDGKIILEVVGYNKPTVTDPELGGTEAPDANDINLNLTEAAAKDFALALNFRTTDTLVKAADVVDGKLVFEYADLVAAMGSDFTGNINDMAIKVSNTFADKYDEIRFASFTYVKDEAAATTEAPTTEAPADDTTTTPADENPKTGAAPVALALIPAALAAVVVAKKRK